ncbi:MAG: Rne/Rng family ribonuclease [Acidobacteriota bacterium]|nr:Rne/Rng family ribonuclease [Acidobacteriota bacterium]
MSKEIYISSTPHETRLAIVESEALTEIYYERENEYTLAGSIYNGRVTRVLPGMQSAFVDIGLERDAFLYITDFMEEAADSAEFESAEGRGSRGDRRPRGERGQGSQGEEPTAEGSRRRDRRDRKDRPAESGVEAGSAEPGDADAAETAGSDDAPMGEGAPGADGSRRWRGRRGRRRGRGGQREAAASSAAGTEPQTADATTDEEAEFDQVLTAGSPDDLDRDPDQDEESGLEFEAAAEADEADEQQSGAEEQASFAPRRDRDGRRRGRDRENRRDRGPRELRGFAPKTDLYGVEGGGEAPASEYAAPAGAPTLLPGESLAKYRPRAEEPAESPAAPARPANVVVPKPSTEYVIQGAWDGGSILPGESLSRHRRGSAAPAAAQPAPTPVVPAPAAEPERTPAAEPEPTPAAAAEPVVEPVAEPVAEPAAAVEVVEAAPVAEPAEYEPTEGSASFRIDPISQSEFRQSAPPSVEPEPAAEPEPTVVPEATIEPEPAAAVEHDVTTLQPTGELLSEPVAVEPVEESAAAALDPIHHEEAIVSHLAPVVETLHASSIEELDDLEEEESLEVAADLGTMLRDMSIDDITSVSEEDDDEDFEEEDAVHDGEELFDDGDETDESDEDEEQDDAQGGEPLEFNGESAFPAPPTSDGLDFIANPVSPLREADRSRRRDGRRDGRRDRGRGDRNDRSRSGERDRSHGRVSRASMQVTNLPAISDLLKPGQEVLVQIAKEPIAKKGARITSHIALPGRFLVFMPTVNHTGVSRKIESDGERRRLKEILLSEKGDASGGFIVRTAAEGASEEELRSDLRFLLNLWADIKQRSEASKSPALIYHDLNLVERILRDQVTDNFSAIWVDTEDAYERVLRFLQRFQPSLIRRVKLYTKETPLFEQFGITEEINKALRSKVWLKSGGSIVINQTEALVAIDINTGKYVGKTARLEDTIVKTNLDAIPEIVRQIRLRDLGGIIIIDFIDMDDRKNRNRVMAALEEELKSDRAPSKVLQFNDFGLVAITRKRVKQSLERTLSTPCTVCAGTGMVKSPITVCNDIYVEMRKMQKHLDRGDVMLRVHPEVVKQLKSTGTRWLQEMEDMVGKTILVKSDPSLHPEQFDIH